MNGEHPQGLDESVLVGDGGRSWFKTQQRNQRQQLHKTKQNRQTDINTSKSDIQNAQTKLLSKQQKKRLKRQKKKLRKQNYKTNAPTFKNNTNNNNPNSSNTRSDFLYGNNNAKPSKYRQNDHANDPYTASPKHRQNTNDNPGFKTYVKSSNQEELNKISAQMLKAKLLSNTALYKELQTKLNALRSNSFLIEHRYTASSDNHQNKPEAPPIHPNKPSTNNDNIEIITDSKISKELHGIDTAIHEDDDINTLLQKERNQTAMDHNKSIFNNKNMKKIMHLDTDDQFDSIDTNKLFEHNNSRKRKRDTQREENKQSLKRSRLISEHKYKTNWLNSCKFCIENEEIHNNEMVHSIIYNGSYMYVAVAKQECLVNMECIIVPNMHLKSFREGILNNEYIGASKEEELAFEKELHTIQKILCKMFKTACECGVVFMETVRNLKKNYHSVIHCYPLKFDLYTLCPTYFKKSILESDVMWSTNKKIVEISKDKPLNKSIPHFMSYFYVQFGLYDGYAHIIEDETKIRQDFGPQIIAGIVGEVLFKIKNESYHKQMERVNAFKTLFEPFREQLDAKLNRTKMAKHESV